jgi:hypothetical protein
LKLIETLGLINGKDYTIENGLIKIYQQALSDKQNEAYSRMQKA